MESGLAGLAYNDLYPAGWCLLDRYAEAHLEAWAEVAVVLSWGPSVTALLQLLLLAQPNWEEGGVEAGAEQGLNN